MPDDIFEYSELIIYGACKTGLGEENEANLVNATYDCGAKIVIGFLESVGSSQVNTWCKVFFENLSQGQTVQYSCDTATSYIQSKYGEYSTINDFYIAGIRTVVFPMS